MATYPVSKPIPGMGLLGVASVLGEFDLSLPLEGVAGLPLGYALQVKDTPSFPGTPEFQGQVRETALQRVRGLQLMLPFGAWPASVLHKPRIYVLDAAEGGGKRPLAVGEGLKLEGPLIVLAPPNITLGMGTEAIITLPVSRDLSRDAADPSKLSKEKMRSLEAHQFVDGKWRRLGGTLRKGLDAWPPPQLLLPPGFSGNVSAELLNNISAAFGTPPDLLVFRSTSLGAVALMKLKDTSTLVVSRISSSDTQVCQW